MTQLGHCIDFNSELPGLRNADSKIKSIPNRKFIKNSTKHFSVTGYFASLCQEKKKKKENEVTLLTLVVHQDLEGQLYTLLPQFVAGNNTTCTSALLHFLYIHRV